MFPVLSVQAKDGEPKTDEDPCLPCSMRGVLGAQGAVESASKYPPDVVMKMSLDEVCDRYKTYVHKLSQLVLLADAPGGSSEAVKEINQIMLEMVRV